MLVAQGVLLLVATTGVYRSGQLSADFAHFHQAWYLMAHGHLNPTSTFYPSTFLNQHGELIMWLIAPLYWLNRDQGLTLLVLQALAIVASIAVAASWLLAVARRHRLSAPVTGICVGVLLALCAFNPWIYAVVYEDFHIEVLAALFALAAGRDLYLGHGRRAVVWILLGLLSGDVAASYVVAVGLALAVAAPGARRRGLVMGGAGVLWVAFLAGIGANTSSPVYGYAYLAGRPRIGTGPGGLFDIVKGTLLHPSRPVHQLRVAGGAIGHNIVPSGILGILDPLMVIPVVAVLLTNGLNSQPVFIGASFQNLAIYIFAPLGTALLCARLASGRSWRTAAVAVVAAVSVGSALAFDLPKLHDGAEIRDAMPAEAQTQLAQVLALTAPSAEVVSTYGVVGRFSSRRWVFTLIDPGASIPVRASQIEFVLAPSLGVNQFPKVFDKATQTFVTAHLQARQIYAGSLVRAYLWRPPKVNGNLVVP